MLDHAPWLENRIPQRLPGTGSDARFQATSRSLQGIVFLPGGARYWKRNEVGPWVRSVLACEQEREIASRDAGNLPTATFRLLYVWFVLDHRRRRALHFNVTSHPASAWVMQQLRDAFPDSPTHRHLIFDNDAIFSPEAALSIARLGICPKRTALRSPWQNGTTERFVGSVRRELLDRVVVLGEDHLMRLLRDYLDYYDRERVHTPLGDAPEGRGVEERPSERSRVIRLPRVGGLRHRYAWSEAAG